MELNECQAVVAGHNAIFLSRSARCHIGNVRYAQSFEYTEGGDPLSTRAATHEWDGFENRCSIAKQRAECMRQQAKAGTYPMYDGQQEMKRMPSP